MSDRTGSACVEHGYGVVAIACSAGGVQALREILSRLDESFPAPILVAMHRGDASSDYFATMLQRSTALEVRQACEGERPQAGTVYLAPGGCHLEVTPAGRLSVSGAGASTSSARRRTCCSSRWPHATAAALWRWC